MAMENALSFSQLLLSAQTQRLRDQQLEEPSTEFFTRMTQVTSSIKLEVPAAGVFCVLLPHRNFCEFLLEDSLCVSLWDKLLFWYSDYFYYISNISNAYFFNDKNNLHLCQLNRIIFVGVLEK